MSWRRISSPTRALTICGTANPMKAIGPTAAVAAALIKVAAPSPPARISPVWTPSPVAASLPRASAFIPPATANAMMRPSSKKGRTEKSWA